MRVSGTEPGQRRLNGPQTTGRDYRDLSPPSHGIREELDAPIAVRDGTRLLADVYRPDGAGRHPALVAFSPYPRQLQSSGLPLGFVEAGATDFFVPRGYAHVLVNARGTCGSGGVYTFADSRERDDLYDAIEWTAAQPWCDGRVGMVGISYFAIAQLAAAVAAPPHLCAVFALSGITDWYRQALWHGGMLNHGFIAAWLHGVGALAGRSGALFRSPAARALFAALRTGPVHRRFERVNGEAAFAILGKALRTRHDARPWDDLYFEVVERTLDDDFWRERDVGPELAGVRIPVYLGSDWDNTALELAAAFDAFDALPADTPVRLSVMDRGGLTWPWESLHVEALAWFDHWLKHRETGIMDGPPIRYYLPGAGEWRAASAWPPEGTHRVELHLRADAMLAREEGEPGGRRYLFLPPGLARMPRSSEPPLPTVLAWDTAPADEPYDLVGHPVLRLDATATAHDVDWIAKLQLVARDGSARDLTQGWLRGSHRRLDEARSRPDRPFHPHDRVDPVVPGEPTSYEIGIVPTAQRVGRGERLRLLLTSCDAEPGFAMMRMTHLPLDRPSRQTVLSSSRLAVPLRVG